MGKRQLADIRIRQRAVNIQRKRRVGGVFHCQAKRQLQPVPPRLGNIRGKLRLGAVRIQPGGGFAVLRLHGAAVGDQRGRERPKRGRLLLPAEIGGIGGTGLLRR